MHYFDWFSPTGHWSEVTIWFRLDLVCADCALASALSEALELGNRWRYFRIHYWHLAYYLLQRRLFILFLRKVLQRRVALVPSEIVLLLPSNAWKQNHVSVWLFPCTLLFHCFLLQTPRPQSFRKQRRTTSPILAFLRKKARLDWVNLFCEYDLSSIFYLGVLFAVFHHNEGPELSCFLVTLERTLFERASAHSESPNRT